MLDQDQKEAPETGANPAEPVNQSCEASEDESFRPGRRFWLTLMPILILALMVSLDGTSVSVALPLLSQDLKGTTIEAFWTGTSFLLASAVLQVPIGALSDIFGRMPVLFCSTLLFLIGIILSAVARDFTLVFVGRAIQGVGGGGVILLNDIVVTDLVPMRQRGKYFGIIGGVWALGSVSGPVIGGALAYKASWRWIFWINVPVAAIALVLIPLTLRLSRPRGSMSRKLKDFDWFGSALFVGAATSFLIPLTWGGVEFPWTDWRTLFPLILGVVAIILFGFLERYWVRNPIINVALLYNYEMAYSLVATAINSAIVYALLYFLPLYFEALKGFDPILSGVALFPATLTVAPFSIVAGVVITKRGEYRWVTWIGWAISTLGLGVMILLDVGTSDVRWFFITFTVGIGLGLLYTSLAIINQAAATEETLTFAIAMFIFFRMLGQCLGVAISGVTFQNQIRTNLLHTQTLADRADEYSRDASSIVQIIHTMPAGLGKTELLRSYAHSLQTVWIVMAALSGVAFIGSLFVKHLTLDREHIGEQGIHQDENTKDKKGFSTAYSAL
ncbi:major facilitator superfamily domain-containing protein [Astrocystis sublimbata]|nr:major facilitator superfamily domain-containing protein [Astrocystis sublimbata]KAI0188079.1 major facilitator superfamily domain-containing protein [Astrocystis sublimbata]